MLNILTIDLEDYYQVSAFESVVRREDWNKYESRIEHNTYRLLEILAEAGRAPSAERIGNEPTPSASRLTPSEHIAMEPVTQHSTLGTPVRATFFCLGWLAERHPHLIKEIQSQGHEIACHSYDHQLVYNMTSEEFRQDIRRSKKTLEDIVGTEVIGYRAPSYSITGKSLWAFQILAEEGFRYDSSIFPIHHDRYGIPNAPRFPFVVDLNNGGSPKFVPLSDDTRSAHCSMPYAQNASTLHPAPITLLMEFPISTVRLFGQNIPISGGGYFRLFPYPVIKSSLKRVNHQDESPFVTYIHPWELDPDQPRLNNISLLNKFRHCINLDSTAGKLKRLLRDFKFSSMKDVFDRQVPRPV